MKRVMRGMLVFAVLMSLMTVAISAEETNVKYEDLANVLKEAGFFKGSNDGFELDREPSRVEGAVMLVRMLGKEELVSSETFEHPFEDVAGWADNYVGYLYVNGMTNGVSDTEFGSEDLITGPQYFTFVLRALGYDDKSGDFSWDKSLEKSLELGILSEDEYSEVSSETFLRDHAVLATYKGLKATIKDSDIQLIANLTDRGDVSESSKSVILSSIMEEEAEPSVTEPNNALENVKSLTITESMTLSGEVIDETMSNEALPMSVDYRTVYMTDFEEEISSSVMDLSMNLYGLPVNSYEEAYADSDHYYVYVGASSFMGFPTEATFDDFYSDETYVDDYNTMFEKALDYTLNEELDDMNTNGFLSAEYEGMEVTSTDTTYIITAKEGFDEYLSGSDEFFTEDTTTNSVKIIVDKETGLMIHMFYDFGMTDEDGTEIMGTFQLDIENIDSTKVLVPENVQEQMDAVDNSL